MKAKKLITYYDILGVKKTATAPEIKEAYWIKAKSVHPDLNKNSPNANKKMAQLNKAYQILIDPIQRAAYDQRILIAFNKQTKTTKKSYTRTNSRSYTNRYNTKTSPNYSYSKPPSSPPKRKTNFQYVYVAIVGFLILIGIFNSNNKTLSSNSANISPTNTPIPTQVIYPTVSVQQTYTNQYYQYPIPTTIPTIDCIGPDGKHLYVTQQECNAFNAAWKPTPTPIIGCGPNAYNSYGYCYCNSGFTRNYTTGQCEKLVCPPNSTESYGSCVCNSGFQRNYTTGQCDPLNCPPNSTVYYNSCLCNNGFYMNYSTNQCVPNQNQ